MQRFIFEDSESCFQYSSGGFRRLTAASSGSPILPLLVVSGASAGLKQVTASIQVLAPNAEGNLRTVQTIPLVRTGHPADGAPVYAPTPGSGGHHK